MKWQKGRRGDTLERLREEETVHVLLVFSRGNEWRFVNDSARISFTYKKKKKKRKKKKQKCVIKCECDVSLDSIRSSYTQNYLFSCINKFYHPDHLYDVKTNTVRIYNLALLSRSDIEISI